MQALILVDIQNDFMPGGSLAVADGNAVVPIANRLMPRFDLVVATQDWHPANHQSFASQHPGKRVGERVQLDGLSQVLWPDHCVQGSAGAMFHGELRVEEIDRIFAKGTDRGIDSYSGFFDNGQREGTGLAHFLTERGATQVHILGLATDYCVMFTALDAVKLGLTTSVILDGCRGVELQSGDVERAISNLRSEGVRIIQSHEIKAP